MATEVEQSITINAPIEKVFDYLYRGFMTFESLGSATKVNFGVELEPKGFFKLAAGMLAGNMKKELEEDLGLAKQLLEAQGKRDDR